MNYRHAFHAGNFADLLKHAVLTWLLRATPAGADRAARALIDTHAGAGLYDLAANPARRTGEAEAAIEVLMGAADAPAVFDPLRAAVRKLNPEGGWRRYPGSPWLMADALRGGDRLFACEARADDHRLLRANVPRANALRGDGWRLGLEVMPPAPAPALVLIDPPYEAPGEAERAAAFIAAALKRNRLAILFLWLPIKDLAGLDATRARLAGLGRFMLVETRLASLDDPLRLNGCALAIFNPPAGLDEPARAAARWVARTLGDPGGSGAVERL